MLPAGRGVVPGRRGASGLGAAGAAGSAGGPEPSPKARAMSSSSTLEAAAFTLKPAFWRIARTSLLGIPFSFAIS